MNLALILVGCMARIQAVGDNSIGCKSCRKWVHRRCSGVKGSRQATATVFVCWKSTKGPPNKLGAAVPRNGFDIGNGDVLESKLTDLLLGRYVKCRQ